MKNIKIKARLYILALLAVVGMVLFSLIVAANFNGLRKIKVYLDEINSTYINYASIINNQKDFFITYKNDPVFFRTEQNDNIRKQELGFNTFKENLQLLIDNPLTTKLGQIDRINQIRSSSENVKNLFREISHALYLRGNVETGLVGTMKDLFKIAKNSTEDPVIKQYLNNMESSFINYLASNDKKYYEKFLNDFVNINNYIQNQGQTLTLPDSIAKDTLAINFASVKPSYSESLIKSVNDLKNNFKRLISIDQRLGINGSQGLINTWIESTNSIKGQFEDYISNVRVYHEKVIKKKIIVFLIMFFVLLAVLVVFLFRIINLFISRFNDLYEFIEPLQYGLIPDTLDTKLSDEVGDLIEIVNKFVIGLKNTAKFAEALGKGNYDVDYKPLSDKDVLGKSLLQLRDDLKRAQEEEQKLKAEERIRQWTNEGISKFADILRQKTETLEELAINVIKNLVNYINANQGAFFYLNDEDPDNIILELKATYAYSKERKKKKTFKLGEGLVGTAVVEKATIYMTDIPEDYITITSGLGGATPRSLLIVPLKTEEEIVGVIELASFNKIKDYEIKFVEHIAESIAATVSIAKINEKTNRLLEQSQLQAKEMVAKEEEMRQNLEELKATQEEAARREAYLQSVLNAIQTATLYTSIDLNGFIIEANDRILQTLSIKREQYIGHHISEFDSEDKLSDPEFWEDLKKGKTIKYTRKFTIEDKVFWFEDYFAPLKDQQGNILRFICISLDITERIKQQEELEAKTKELEEKEQMLQQKVQEAVEAQKKLQEEKEKADRLVRKLQASEEILKKALVKVQAKEKELLEKTKELQTEKLILKDQLENLTASKEILAYIQRQKNKLKEIIAEKDRIIEDLQKKIEELQKGKKD